MTLAPALRNPFTASESSSTVVRPASATMITASARRAAARVSAARALQGVGGALLVPSSLAILQASFAPGDRARAIGAWSGLTGVAAAAMVAVYRVRQSRGGAGERRI